MKKSKINPDEILKDLNSLLDFADMVDELDSSNINKEKLEEQAKKLENKISKKYKDHLDIKK